MITIKDVARGANVSVATASYALNGEGRVSTTTRATVMRVAHELGYVPHLGARALKGQAARAMGIFVDGVAGPVFGELIEGAQEYLKAQGWGLIVTTLNEPARELANALVGGSLLAGAIVINPLLAAPDLLRNLLDRTPTILLDADPVTTARKHALNCLRVALDNADGMRRIATHLLARGCRRFVYLDGSAVSWDATERRKSFGLALAQAGVLLPAERVLSGEFRTRQAYTALHRFMEHGDAFDAVVCANDEMALGAATALREAGFRVPDDVALTGFDDIEQAAWSHPSLTTITVRRRELGAAMAGRLITMAGGQDADGDMLFGVSLVVRGSSMVNHPKI